MSRTKASRSIVLTPGILAAARARDVGKVIPLRSSTPVDFSESAIWGELGSAVVHAATRKQKAKSSLENDKHRVRLMFRAIASVCDDHEWAYPTAPGDLTPELVGKLFGYVRALPNPSADSREFYCSAIAAILRKVVDFPIAVPEARLISTVRPSWRPLAPDLVERLLAAARRSVEAFRIRREAMEALVASPRDYGSARIPRDHDGLVHYWAHRYGAVPLPTEFLGRKGGCGWRYWVYRLGLQPSDMFSAVYPLPEDLLPFVLILTAIYGLNVRGIMDLEVNALGQVDGETVLRYVKYRAGGEFVTAPVPPDVLAEVQALIETAVAATARARLIAPQEKKHRLWLVLKRIGRGGSSIEAMDYDGAKSLFKPKLSEWCARHGLTEDDTSYLMSRLRKHAASREYTDAAGASISSQRAAIEKSTRRLGQVGNILRPYAHMLITDGDCIRAVADFGRDLEAGLKPYGI